MEATIAGRRQIALPEAVHDALGLTEDRLSTRRTGFFRDYFKGLEVIAPQSG
jgi:hypothetical protein